MWEGERLTKKLAHVDQTGRLRDVEPRKSSLLESSDVGDEGDRSHLESKLLPHEEEIARGLHQPDHVLKKVEKESQQSRNEGRKSKTKNTRR